jgi:transcriptional regulator GlxA family with amidase domain
MSQTAKPKKVYFLLYEGVQLLDVSGPAEVLSQANRGSKQVVYDIKYVGYTPEGKVTSTAGLPLFVDPLPPSSETIHTIVVPGAAADALNTIGQCPVVMAWLNEAVAKADVVSSICSGAFLLGQLGHLDQRRATTHWKGTRRLQSEFPKAKGEQDTLFVRDQNLWTSAGVLSGVDMMLAMVRSDLGAAAALAIARTLVVFLIRDGGQSQFSGSIDLQTKASKGDVVSLIAWLEAQLHKPISVEQMADFLNLSVRTLHRRCLQALDMTPAQVLSELRLERSRNLLHELSIPLKTIAHECGFATPEAYSKAFRQRFNIAPKRYRERFNL